MAEQMVLMLNTPLIGAVLGGIALFVFGIKVGQKLQDRQSGGGRFIKQVTINDGR